MSIMNENHLKFANNPFNEFILMIDIKLFAPHTSTEKFAPTKHSRNKLFYMYTFQIIIYSYFYIFGHNTILSM